MLIIIWIVFMVALISCLLYVQKTATSSRTTDKDFITLTSIVDADMDNLTLEEPEQRTISRAQLAKRGAWRLALDQTTSKAAFEKMAQEEYRKMLD